MGHACCGGHCGHDNEEGKTEDSCGCGHAHGADAQEDIARLMQAIKEAGFQADATPDGDIKISE